MDYSINFGEILISLALTAIAYVGPPVAFSFIIKKRRITKSEAKKICIVTGIGMYLVFFFLYAYFNIDGGGSLYPAFIWSSIAYWILSITRKESPIPTKTSAAIPKQIQENKAEEETKVRSNTTIHVDSLKSLKELHDEGVITDEEYTEKKKQILGI